MPTGIGGEKLWLCPSLDDSSDDISGNGNHGTYNGGMGTVADTSNGGTRAYSFDGSNDYIDTGSTSIHSTDEFSYSCWLKWTPSGFMGFMSAYETPSDRGPALIAYNNDPQFLFQSNGGVFNSSERLTPTYNMNDGNWHHLVGVFDGNSGSASLYVDGSLVASSSSVPSNVNYSTSLKFGKYVTYFLNGYLDDIRVFDRALSTTEITHLATSRGIEGSPYTYSGLGDEKLWLCPSLDDSADDISGNGNHGTYNGGMGTVADVSNGGTRAYSFDGVDDYINCGNSIDTSTPLSVSCWFNSDQERRYQGLVTRSSASSFPNFILYTSNVIGSGGFGTYIGAHRQLTSLISTGTWYHACFTLDASGNLNLYLDGVLVKSDTSVSMGYSQSFDLLIGEFQAATGADYPHDGLMDDIRVFDRALSTSEITALASKRGYEVPAASGSIPHPLSAPIFHPLG